MNHSILQTLKSTYEGYLTWSDEDHYEMIEGKVYTLSHAPSSLHQRVCVELSRQMANYFLGKPGEVFVAPFDVRFPNHHRADKCTESVVRPDIVVVCDESKIDEQGCYGAPDWIIEVLSPATAAKDYTQKRLLYEKYGVKEYWLVHPVDKVVMLFKQEGVRGYGKPCIYETVGTLVVDSFPDLVIDWSLVFRKVA